MGASDDRRIVIEPPRPDGMLARWGPAVLEGLVGKATAALGELVATSLSDAGIEVREGAGTWPVFVMPAGLEAPLSALEAEWHELLGKPVRWHPLVPTRIPPMRLGLVWVEPTLGIEGRRLVVRGMVGERPLEEQVLVLEETEPGKAAIVSHVLICSAEERPPNLRFGSPTGVSWSASFSGCRSRSPTGSPAGSATRSRSQTARFGGASSPVVRRFLVRWGRGWSASSTAGMTRRSWSCRSLPPRRPGAAAAWPYARAQQGTS